MNREERKEFRIAKDSSGSTFHLVMGREACVQFNDTLENYHKENQEKIMADLKEQFEEVKGIVESTEKDLVAFADKGNNAAGTRVRKAMQELKVLCQAIRVDVQEIKNNK